MKMHFTKWAWVCSALMIAAFMVWQPLDSNAQATITQNFDVTTTLPVGWTATAGWATNPTFTVTDNRIACAGTRSARVNIFSTSTSGRGLNSPSWISNGDPVEVTFDYKIINFGSPYDATSGNWGSLSLRVSADNGLTYTTVYTIDESNHVVSAACEQVTVTIDGSLIPNGSQARVQWWGVWNAFDWYAYVDDVTIFQDGTFDCENLLANIGSPCDDGNIFTTGTTVDAICECSGGTIIESVGCNTGSPFSSLNPVCSGPVLNQSGAWTNEYVLVNNIEQDVSYTFSLSNPNYLATITSADGLTILAFGQATASITADFNGSVRFYSHAGADCPITTGSATSHIRTVTPGACNFDCPLLEANIGDACTLAGFFDTAVNADCECVGTAFDCDLGNGEFVNIGDACELPTTEPGYEQTVATEALGFPTTFDANPGYIVSVPAGFDGAYSLTVSAAGEVFGGSWRNEFRVQILDPNGNNVTQGAPGGNLDEWQPTTLTQGGTLEGTVNLGEVVDPAGDWTIRVRLSINEGPQVNANIDITLAFEPAPIISEIGADCACIVPEPPFVGCNTGFSYGSLNPACGATANSPSDSWTNEYSNVTVVNGDEYLFALSNPDYYVTITSADGLTILAAAQSSVSWTADLDGTVRMYSHIDAICSTTTGSATNHVRSATRTCTATFDCPLIFANIGDACDDGDPFTTGTTIDADCECSGGTVIVFEGCTTGTSFGTLTPVCNGPVVNLAGSWTNEYSNVNVVIGGVYTFTLSNLDYFVTIASSDNSTILAAAQGSVEWTSDIDGAVRFYSHAGPDCPTTTGSATSHTRSVSLFCPVDCPELLANFGDACTIAGFFDATVSEDCECVGTPFDCDLGNGEYVNIGDPCTLPTTEPGYEQTVATEALGFPNTFADNAEYTITVPASFDGDYILTASAAGEVFGGSWRNEFRVQILDPNGNNVTQGAPGGNLDEWQPTTLTQGGTLEGTVNLGDVTNPSGDWTVRVRLSFNEGPQVNANIDITLAFEPAPVISEIGADCACIVPEPPFVGCNTGFSYGSLNPACGATANSPFDSWTNEYSNVTVVNGDDYLFALSNPDYYVTITSADGLTILAAAQSSVSWTADLDGTVRMYSHIDAICSTTTGSATNHVRSATRTCNTVFDCPLIFANIGDACDDGDPFTTGTTIDADCECSGGTVIVFEGCTTGGLFITLSPVCNGPAVNAAGSWTNEYSNVNVVTGGVYTFTLSNLDYFVTIASSDNSTILAAAQGSVEWTSDFDGSVRFYSHAGPDCPTTTGSATSHTRSVSLFCPVDCPELLANFGDACTIAGFFDATVSEDCECVGTPFDCDLGDGEYANFGDACTIPGTGPTLTETVSAEAFGFPNTFDANPTYSFEVPAGFSGTYDLTVDAAGEVFGGSWRSEFRVRITDPNGNNITQGAPGGNLDEWQPSSLTQGGPLEGSITFSGLTAIEGTWNVEVRLSFNEGPQINANVDLFFAFAPAGIAGEIDENCGCSVPCASVGGTLSSSGTNTVCVGTGSPVTFDNAVLTGAAGQNSIWVLTKSINLVTQATSTTGPDFDLDGRTPGNYRIWHVSYSDDVDINEVLTVQGTPGCWEASNPLFISLVAAPEASVISTNSLTTVCGGEGTPKFVLASATGGTGIGSRWALTDADGNILDTRGNNTNFNLDPLAAGTYYIYDVQSVVAVGQLPSTSNVNDLGSCAAVSNGIEITVLDCSGSALLTSVPNPTNGPSWVTFSVEKAQMVQVEVYDLSGRLVETLFRQNAEGAHSYTVQFDGSKLPNGVYIYRMTTESEVVIDKFMIAR